VTTKRLITQFKEIDMSTIAKAKYGYFDADAREYVITRPDTPRPWYNYMMNDTYVGMISNTGGGVSYDTDPRVFRLLRYRYQNVPYDRPGRYVYIRDAESKRYWSATWAPVHTPLDECTYRCRVGMGYQVVTFEHDGIRTELTYFVPPKGKLEIWDLKVTNISDRRRKLQTFSYAEFAFWGASRDLLNIDNTPNVSRQRYEDGSILHYSYNDIGTGLHDMHFVQNYGFHTSSPAPKAYNGDRDLFLGNYRDEKNPLVVETGRSTNYCENSGYPIGSLEHRFTLAPGKTKRIVYRTGMSPREETWKADAAQYSDFAEVDAAFAALKAEWEDRLGRFVVKTPDRNFDAVVNSFVQYQSAMTMRLSRSISPYEWGIGRSIGFRDSSQDQMGMMHAFPELGRRMLSYIVSAINEKGEACHNFNPITKSWGSVGHFYDDHNWPALTVNLYVRETGDVDFLHEQLPYAPLEKKASAFEHLAAAQDNAWSKRGTNGLMQIGAADWNDSLNPGDRTSESVFTSCLYCASTKALIELARLIGENKLAVKWQKRYDTIKKLLNTVAWDGAWYQRIIKKSGEILGSKDTKEYGRIFLEPQPWAVMAGVADGRDAAKLLDEVEKRLGTPYGHKIMDRPFMRFDMEEIGSAGIFPGGIKENGSVFNHASAWMISAEAVLGRGDKAHEYFMRKAGTTKNKYAQTYECEPYVSCQFISQPPFHIVGRGRNTWLTGSAAWIALGAMQGVIGCRPGFDGLVIDPSIPSKWKKFELTRVFRGTTYKIRVENPKGVQNGVQELYVDGEKVQGNTIPHDGGKKEVAVRVVMG
jgi:cellobiose phosphorylase